LLVAIYGLAYRQGMDKERVMQVCGSALQPAGIIHRHQQRQQNGGKRVTDELQPLI
jgi:hypothetical protein